LFLSLNNIARLRVEAKGRRLKSETSASHPTISFVQTRNRISRSPLWDNSKRKTIRPSPRSSVNDEQRLTRVNQRAVSIIFKLFGATIVAVGVDKAKARPEIAILNRQTARFANYLRNKGLPVRASRTTFINW